MSKRPAHIWQIEPIAKLAEDINDAMRRYESYCHEAAARSPEQWRHFWHEEARAVNRTRSHLFNRTTEWLLYASGKKIETLGLIEDCPPAAIDAPERKPHNEHT